MKKIIVFLCTLNFVNSLYAQNSVENCNEKLHRVFINGLSGAIDTSGKIVIPAKFKNLSVGDWKYSERCDDYPIPAQDINELYGFLNKDGTWLVFAKYKMLSCFINGLASISDASASLINSSGKKIGISADEIVNTGGGPITAQVKGEVFYLDLNGKFKFKSPSDKLKLDSKDILQNDSLYSYAFHEGIANFKKGNLWGAIDYTGKIVINEQFKFLGEFNNGAAVACPTENNCGLINESGKYILNPEKFNIHDIGDGMYSIQKLGTFDFSLVNVKKHKYIASDLTNATHCNEGICIVSKAQNRNECHDKNFEYCWSAIDYNGKTIFKFPKNTTYPYKYVNGFISFSKYTIDPVNKKEVYKLGYLDKKGKIILRPIFDTTSMQTSSMSCGLTGVRIEGATGYINIKGEYIWNPRK